MSACGAADTSLPRHVVRCHNMPRETFATIEAHENGTARAKVVERGQRCYALDDYRFNCLIDPFGSWFRQCGDVLGSALWAAKG